MVMSSISKDSRDSRDSASEMTDLGESPAKRKRRLLRRSFGLFRDRQRQHAQSPGHETPGKRLWRRNGRSSAPGSLGNDTSSTEDAFRDDYMTEAMMRTHIVPMTETPQPEEEVEEEPDREDEIAERVDQLECSQYCSGPTAILQHSYFELLCGPMSKKGSVNDSLYHRKNTLPDDPTIQESIECVFASQLEEGLPYMLLGDDEEKPDRGDLIAPSSLQQSMMKSRSNRIFNAPSQIRKRKVHGSLVHLQTLDHAKSDESAQKATMNCFSPVSSQCSCCSQSRPLLDPSRWPQRPLLLRPTPGSGTRIKGIRFSGSDEYIWEAKRSVLTWPSSLKAHWGIPELPGDSANPLDVMCSECMVLPINNGNEPAGECLVTDFYTDLFEGTLLLRLRETEGTTPQQYDDSWGYFAGMNRRYQVVIRGNFRKEIPWTECLNGFKFDRRYGKLPAKWILNGALKVISFFAPQLQADFDGDQPSNLTPLGSTPQSLSVENSDVEPSSKIDEMHYEPKEAQRTLLGQASTSSSSVQRARFRKKAFDKLFSQESQTPVTDPSKIYTFEFLQHLFNFQDFSVELGALLGSVKLKEILDGQPLRIMSCHDDQKLWSFDIWHESLVEDAKRHDEKMD